MGPLPEPEFVQFSGPQPFPVKARPSLECSAAKLEKGPVLSGSPTPPAPSCQPPPHSGPGGVSALPKLSRGCLTLGSHAIIQLGGEAPRPWAGALGDALVSLPGTEGQSRDLRAKEPSVRCGQETRAS